MSGVGGKLGLFDLIRA